MIVKGASKEIPELKARKDFSREEVTSNLQWLKDSKRQNIKIFIVSNTAFKQKVHPENFC
jgi:hypothetical protein